MTGVRVTHPAVELLAIKLYEHDTRGGEGGRTWPPRPGWGIDCWAALDEEDRETYRAMARGEEDLYGVE